MITDFDAVESGLSLEVDLCIVGSGVAGLVIASEYLGRGKRVLILEAGGRAINPESQDMYRAQVVGCAYNGHTEGRYRVFGGTSTRWGGQLITLDPSDFEPRKSSPGSGWPMRIEDIDSYYDRALALLRADDLPYDRAIWPVANLHPLAFDESVFRFRYAKWIPFRYRNLAMAMQKKFAQANDVEVMLNAPVTHIQLEPVGRKVDHVVIRSTTGKQCKVRSRHYVLCCGTIETARLLLASNDLHKLGVGNANDLVGRYFQDHINRRCADLIPRITRQYLDSFSPFFRGNVMHSPRLELRPEAQREFGCLSAFAQILAEPPDDSGFVVVREMLRRMQALQGFLPTATELRNALHDFPYVVRLGLSRYLGGRVPYPPRCRWRLSVDVEQEPNPESRIYLTRERDALGMPMAAIDWRVGERERKTAAQYVTVFRREWERLNLGEAAWDETIHEPGEQWLKTAVDTYHQAGTTRMGNNPRTSVVNTDLRVHDVDNLFIGSCSVFPTSGSANPTFTMAALCLRLADYLRPRL